MRHLTGWMVGALIGCPVLVSACDEDASTPARAAAPVTRPAAAPTGPTTTTAASGMTTAFTVTLPPGVRPDDVRGLDVTLKSVGPEAHEPVFLQVLAAYGPPGQPTTKPSSIGTHTIFRPLKKGESMVASVGAPPQRAWVKTDKGTQAVVQVDVLSSPGTGAVPPIDLQIVDVKPAIKR